MKKHLLTFFLCIPFLLKSSVPVDSSRYSGFVIALAWPNALAKQTNDWYDGLMRGIGFNDDGYYRVGHAALILVDASDGSCHFFDFGRYHTPIGKGRVRDAETDAGLKLSIKAVIEGKAISNYEDILCEVSANPSTHASGNLYASYVRIDFLKAFEAAKQMQQLGAINYGPFDKDGSNCSRFVRSIILAGEPNWAHALRLELVPMITPTTLFPIAALYHWVKVPGCLNRDSELLKEEMAELDDSTFNSTLPIPLLPGHLPTTCQWLSGESAGSWFHVSQIGEDFLIKRFAPKGNLECEGVFTKGDGEPFNLDEPYVVSYLSHCATVVVEQGGRSSRLTKKPHEH